MSRCCRYTLEIQLENPCTFFDSILTYSAFYPLREDCVAKIPEIRKMIERTGRDILIEVDGGVKQSNAARVIDAGADVLVMGTGLFRAEDPKAVVQSVMGA